MVLGGTLVLTVRGQHCSGARIGGRGPQLLWGPGGRIGSQGPQLLWVQGAELVGKGQHCCGDHGAALTDKAPLCHPRGCTGTEGSSLSPLNAHLHHTQNILCDLLNVCSKHKTFKLQWTRVKSKETVGNSWTVLKVILGHKYHHNH